MRLVIDGQRLTTERTGVGRYLETLLAEWAETGWPLADVLLVLRERSALAGVAGMAGLRTVVVGEGWPGLAWETFGLGRRLGPGDLLFAPANLVPWTWRGKTVAVVHDALPWSVPSSFPWHVRLRFGWRYRMAARRADRVIVPSLATAAEVRRVFGVDDDRLAVVYPGPDPGFRPTPPDTDAVREARRAFGLGEGAYFLFVGKRSRRRNVPAVLRAFDRHRASHPHTRLVFVGPGGGDALPAAGAGSGVIDAGHVGEPTLRGLLAGAAGLLYPSEFEGFGLPVVEAQASGCPVVTLRNSALVESAGDAAWFLDSPTPDAIAEAMRALQDDPAARRELVGLGLANAARFSRRAFAGGVRDEIRRVARPGSSGPVSRSDPGPARV